MSPSGKGGGGERGRLKTASIVHCVDRPSFHPRQLALIFRSISDHHLSPPPPLPPSSSPPPITLTPSHPVDLVADPAVFHLLHLHIGQALVTALVALATAWPGAVLLAHHSGLLGNVRAVERERERERERGGRGG